MSHSRKRGMTDFEFYQTEYLGGKISQTHTEYKDFAMKETDMIFGRWFIENIERLSLLPPDKAVIEILDTRAKLEYLRGTTEITQMSMKLGELAKKSDARNLGGILKRARDGIVITDK